MLEVIDEFASDVVGDARADARGDTSVDDGGRDAEDLQARQRTDDDEDEHLGLELFKPGERHGRFFRAGRDDVVDEELRELWREHVERDADDEKDHHECRGDPIRFHQLEHAADRPAMVDAARAGLAFELEHQAARGAAAGVVLVFLFEGDLFAFADLIEARGGAAEEVFEAVGIADEVEPDARDFGLEQARPDDGDGAEFA